MATHEQLSNAADLHMAAYRAGLGDQHYDSALQYQRWAIEARR